MKTGSLFSASGISVGVVCISCSAVTAVIGVGDRLMSEMMREPVTVTDSVFCAVCCAWAAPVLNATTLAAHINASLFTLVLLIFPPGKFFVLDDKTIRHWQRCQPENDSATIFVRPL